MYAPPQQPSMSSSSSCSSHVQPPASTFAKNENWYRLGSLVYDAILPALLEVFHNASYSGLPRNPSELFEELNTTHEAKLHELRKNRSVINQQQYDLLLPPTRLTNSRCFDITLIVVLIRNFVDLPAPSSRNWKLDELKLDDVSIASYVIRGKELRNYLCHHEPCSVDDATFEKKWQEGKAVIKGLNYECNFHELRHVPLDNLSATNIQKFIEHEKALDELTSRVDDLEREVISLKNALVKAVQLRSENMESQKRLFLSIHVTLKECSKAAKCVSTRLCIKDVSQGTSISKVICKYVNLCISTALGTTNTDFRVTHTNSVISTTNDMWKDTLQLELRYKSPDGQSIPACYYTEGSEEWMSLINEIEETLTIALQRELHFDSKVSVVSIYEGSISIVLMIKKCSGIEWLPGEIGRVTICVTKTASHIVISNAVFQTLYDKSCHPENDSVVFQIMADVEQCLLDGKSEALFSERLSDLIKNMKFDESIGDIVDQGRSIAEQFEKNSMDITEDQSANDKETVTKEDLNMATKTCAEHQGRSIAEQAKPLPTEESYCCKVCQSEKLDISKTT